MGFAIAKPERFEKYALVARRETPISRWPCAPGTDDEAGDWLLLGFMFAGGDEAAVYGRLKKDHRQSDGWAGRVAAIAEEALNAHAEKALTKAQIRTALEQVLGEIS